MDFYVNMMQGKSYFNSVAILSLYPSIQMFTRQLQFGREHIMLVQEQALGSDNLTLNPGSSYFIRVFWAKVLGTQ